MAHTAQEERSEDTLRSDSEEGSDSECYGTNVKRLDAEERQELRDRGMVVREGAWSGLEDEQLKKNMTLICKKYGIDEPRKLIYPDQYPDAKETRNLVDEEMIYMKLRKGIQRPVYNVYIRARKIFDPQNYLGRFSDDEVKMMKELALKMGTRWSQISKKMGRSGRSLCDRYKVSGKRNSGSWSEEEKARLVKVVKRFSGFNQDQDVEKLFFNIPWRQVQEAMKTRNVLQCRREWINIVSWAVADKQSRYTSRGRWRIEDNIRLIESVYNMDIHDEQDIDWMALLNEFHRIPSPQKLKYHWYRLKMRYIPNYRFKTFEEIVCQLHEFTLLNLRGRLAKNGTNIVSREIVEDDSDSEREDVESQRNDSQNDGVAMTTNRGITDESLADRMNEQGQVDDDSDDRRSAEHTDEGLNIEVEREERNNIDRQSKKKKKKRQRSEHATSDADGDMDTNVSKKKK
nr:transcription termination factor 1-like [Lytechinus pictus]